MSKKRCTSGAPLTLCKRSFHDGGEGLSLSYLSFLVQKRELTDYKVVHFLFYRKKTYLTPFLERMLQRRHEYKREGDNPIAAEGLKLLLNR